MLPPVLLGLGQLELLETKSTVGKEKNKPEKSKSENSATWICVLTFLLYLMSYPYWYN